MKECDGAFSKLKEHLSNPPTLVKLIVEKSFKLYITMINQAISSRLVQEVEGRKMLIYFISEVLQSVEFIIKRLKKQH